MGSFGLAALCCAPRHVARGAMWHILCAMAAIGGGCASSQDLDDRARIYYPKALVFLRGRSLICATGGMGNIDAPPICPARLRCRIAQGSSRETPLAGDQVRVCKALGIVEHGNHRRRHAEDAHIGRRRHWKWQGILLRVLQHQQAQDLLRFARVDHRLRARRVAPNPAPHIPMCTWYLAPSESVQLPAPWRGDCIWYSQLMKAPLLP